MKEVDFKKRITLLR